jgi:hypothetical protein
MKKAITSQKIRLVFRMSKIPVSSIPLPRNSP